MDFSWSITTTLIPLRKLWTSKTGDHDGIRIVTSIGKDNMDLIRAFLKIGVQ